ncbi:V0D/AC39 family V-type ATPase subunit [Treponema bryantii]|uniref:V0D/AC39 family V-type ATPase subunit n=1 Tax=Treponema bryantii TaxID=163 RepID=UPI0003B4AE5F|nr:V-type ATPase subunit [Treponema bryantii]
MDKTGAGAYIFAKANGILGKSFTGKRAQKLFAAKSLGELWTLLFRSQPPMVPEVMLSQQIEEKAFSDFTNQFVNFISLYDKPEEVLKDQLLMYDGENLKELGAALCKGEPKCPAVISLKNYSSLNYAAWPDIKKITKGSPFSWYNKVPGIHEQQELDFKIDIQICRHLWDSAARQKGEAGEALLKLYRQEFIIKNIVWVLRLRLYYNMKAEDITKNLIYVTDKPGHSDPIAAPALKILDWPLDEYEVWSNWRYASLVNPYEPGTVWQIDPIWIEKRNRVEINRKAAMLFHQFPGEPASLIGWYKMKEFELSCIRTAVESIRLNVNPEEAMDAIGGING